MLPTFLEANLAFFVFLQILVCSGSRFLDLLQRSENQAKTSQVKQPTAYAASRSL